jgi:hypothetical protein
MEKDSADERTLSNTALDNVVKSHNPISPSGKKYVCCLTRPVKPLDALNTTFGHGEELKQVIDARMRRFGGQM